MCKGSGRHIWPRGHLIFLCFHNVDTDNIGSRGSYDGRGPSTDMNRALWDNVDTVFDGVLEAIVRYGVPDKANILYPRCNTPYSFDNTFLTGGDAR